MTYFELVKSGRDTLMRASVTEADNDAFMLFSYVSGFDRTAYLMKQRDTACEDLIQRYDNVIKQRAAHKPLQQITGRAYFMGYEFFVDENVLIPRFDTEVLVSECLKYIKKDDEILDMCTGSGCIIHSLMLLSEAKSGVGVDKSELALKVAAKNGELLKSDKVELINSDLFDKVECHEYDMIVSNPPYIKTAVIEGLEAEVKEYEPMMALDGYEDGLFFYRRITENAAKYLKSEGYLCYEIGYDQGSQVADIMKTNNFYDINIIKDLAGLDRVVTGRLKK